MPLTIKTRKDLTTRNRSC